jgi:hypothetical protein
MKITFLRHCSLNEALIEAASVANGNGLLIASSLMLGLDWFSSTVGISTRERTTRKTGRNDKRGDTTVEAK